MNKTVRAVLIDPKRETIEEISMLVEDGRGYLSESLSEDGRPGILPESVVRFGEHPFPMWSIGHVLYVDQEGIPKKLKNHFRFRTGALPVFYQWRWLSGTGLIVNHKGTSDYFDHGCDLDFLRESIEFTHGRNPNATPAKVHSW